MRLGDLVVLELYMPHRCAYQCIPADTPSSSDIRANLAGAVRYWEAILRVETHARFIIPRTRRSLTFTAPYRRWFRDMTQVCMVPLLSAWMRGVLTQPEDHVSVRSAPPLEIVADMQSRDSRLIHRRVMVSDPSRPGIYY